MASSLGGSYTVRPCGHNHSSVATPPYSRRGNRKPPHAGCREKKSAALPRSACDDFETVRIAEVYDISSVFVMFSRVASTRMRASGPCGSSIHVSIISHPSAKPIGGTYHLRLSEVPRKGVQKAILRHYSKRSCSSYTATDNTSPET